MRKDKIIAYCVTICLLSAVPENQGSKLLESLSCLRPYPHEKLICTWSENDISKQLVNLTLMEVRDKPTNVCQEISAIKSSPTHSTWTCHMPWSLSWSRSDTVKFGFMPERDLANRHGMESESDMAKPQNLSCNNTAEGRIACSWNIRAEIAESLDFSLFYDNDDKECRSSCLPVDSEYLSCHCTLITDGHRDTSALLNTISVKPRTLESSNKAFTLCMHYQLPASILMINETKKGEDFRISWKLSSVPESIHFKYNYELCYWNHQNRGDLKLKKDPETCPGTTLNISNNHDSSIIFQLDNQLNASSNYSMKIRVRLKDVNPNQCYQGPWSEWSEVKTLTTKAVLNPLFLYILIPICVIILVVCAFCGYRALIRYKKQWEEGIPNPNKSTIIKGFQKTKAIIAYSADKGTCLPYEENLYVEPYNNIAMCTSSVSKESPHFYQNLEQICRPDSHPIPEDDTDSVTFCELSTEYFPAAIITDGYKAFTDLTNEEESKDVQEEQFTFSAFDGPYLYSESNLSS